MMIVLLRVFSLEKKKKKEKKTKKEEKSTREEKKQTRGGLCKNFHQRDEFLLHPYFFFFNFFLQLLKKLYVVATQLTCYLLD